MFLFIKLDMFIISTSNVTETVQSYLYFAGFCN